ncbi:aminoglycoside phosphotransferase family protein [Aeromicrobium sp. UC242_57]|uniref:aminoglycoside phosphotransferase family protein n=1 Tax=Aeromicrobium sp. UC242_57 TaxID=3374624 RepID=UPI00378E2F48
MLRCQRSPVLVEDALQRRAEEVAQLSLGRDLEAHEVHATRRAARVVARWSHGPPAVRPADGARGMCRSRRGLGHLDPQCPAHDQGPARRVASHGRRRADARIHGIGRSGGRCGGAAGPQDRLPHDEGQHEALALRHWDGHGAAGLVRADPRRGALLLERLHVRSLQDVPVLEACSIVAGLYRQLHLPAPAQASPSRRTSRAGPTSRSSAPCSPVAAADRRAGHSPRSFVRRRPRQRRPSDPR